MNIQSPECSASLTTSSNSRKGTGLESHIKISIFHNYCCVIAAELQESFPKPLFDFIPDDGTRF